MGLDSSLNLSGPFADFGASEEERYLLRGGLWRIRTMNGVSFYGLREVFANGAFRSFGWIGGAHDFTVLGDGVFTFQDLNHDRTGPTIDQPIGLAGCVQRSPRKRRVQSTSSRRRSGTLVVMGRACRSTNRPS